MWNKIIDLDKDRFGFKVILHCIIGLVLFIASNILAALASEHLSAIIKTDFIMIIINCVLEIGLFLSLIFLYIHKGLKKTTAFFRININRPAPIFVIVAFLLPVCVFFFYYFFIDGSLSFFKDRMLKKFFFALKVGLSAGISEEILFRGYIMKLLENRWNKIVAILAPSVLFASGHLFAGMAAADIIQLFIAGITVGIMFSLVAYAFDTVNNAIIIHGFWNFIIIGIISISAEADNSVFFSCTFKSSKILLTGGRFGIESGAPAIIAYIAVICLAVFIKKRNLKLAK